MIAWDVPPHKYDVDLSRNADMQDLLRMERGLAHEQGLIFAEVVKGLRPIERRNNTASIGVR